MPLPITIPYTFATATSAIPLSQLDSDFSTVVNAINGIGNGTNSLSNVVITGGTIDNVAIGATTSTTGKFTTVTATTGNITTINATTTNSATIRSDSSLTFQSNGTTTAMTITTGQNVGIGNTAPAYRLVSVGGQVQLSPGTSAQEGIRLSRSSGVMTLNGINNDNNAYNALAFSTSASEAMRIDTSGNVGIGTSSPGVKLDVSGNIQTSNNYMASAASYVYSYAGGTNAQVRSGMYMDGTNQILASYTANTERMRIDSSGNVGIGTVSPAYALDVAGSAARFTQGAIIPNNNWVFCGNASGTYRDSFGYFTDNNLYVTAWDGAMILRTGGNNERARIDSSGSLNVGGTGANNGGAILHAERSTSAVVGRYYASQSSGYTSDVLQAITNQGSSTACTIFGAYYSGGAAFAFRVRGDGTIYAQNTTVQSASDVRFKENIVDATEGLDVISSLRPVRFDIKEGHGVSAKENQLGFIAQEVQEVFPDAVDIWKESDDPEKPYLSLGSTALIPVLVKAIQELKEELDAIKGAK